MSACAISGGLLWLVYAFAGALIVNRSFARELPNDCLDVLIASPVPGWAIFLGKAMACFILLLIVELVSLPIFGLFYNIQLDRLVPFASACDSVGDLGYHGGRAAPQRRHGECAAARVDAAGVLYPLMIPLLIGAMEMTTRFVERQRRAERHPAADRIRCDVHIARAVSD